MKPIYELEMAKEPKTRNNIMIVDCLNLAFRYKTKDPSFRDSYYNTIKSLAKSYEAKYVILAADKGSSRFRLNMYPEYKADRIDKIGKQTEEEKAEFMRFFEEYEAALELCSKYYPLLRYDEVEADDIAAWLTEVGFLGLNSRDIWLISSDKDWDLLLRSNVSRFSFVTRKEYTLNNWGEHYDYPHYLALDVKAICGGKDNIKGISGIGEKRAMSLFNKYGDIYGLISKLPLDGTAQYIKNLNAGLDTIMLNLDLIDKSEHCEEAVGLENIEDIKEKLKGIL